MYLFNMARRWIISALRQVYTSDTFYATFDPEDEMYVTRKSCRDQFGLTTPMVEALEAANEGEHGVLVSASTKPNIPDDAVHPNTAKALHRRDLARHRMDTRRLITTDKGENVIERMKHEDANDAG